MASGEGEILKDQKRHPYQEEKTPGPSSIFDGDFSLPTQEPQQTSHQQEMKQTGEKRKKRIRRWNKTANRGAEDQKRPRRRRSWKARLVLALLALFVVGAGGLAAYLGVATRNDDLWLDLDQIPYKTGTVIYAREEGGEWEEYAVLPCTQNKEYVPGDQMPQALKDAFIAAEDKDFYTHSGVNLLRTGYAVATSSSTPSPAPISAARTASRWGPPPSTSSW